MANKNVTCKIKLYTPWVKKLTGALVPALENTVEEVHQDLKQAQTLPLDTSNLKNNTFIDCTKSSNGTVSLISSTPYARRLYYHPEYHFNQKDHCNAKGRWLDDYLPGGKKEDFAQNAFEKFYEQETEL